MATTGIYRRVLPSPPAIEFASPQGKQLFAEAFQNGTMEGFFKLISYFQTQSEPAYCGLASISMVLNALAIDPGRKWKGPWRWFDESMLDCCDPLEKIKTEGITFAKVVCLAICSGAKVEALRTNQFTIDDFRQYVIACTSSEDCHVITSYHRQAFKQTGTGHFSPVGGYHTGEDMVLILDVARFKYPPHWVPLPLLWEAMNTIDEATGLQRGFMIISRPQKAPSLLYTLSCKHDIWISTAKRLIDDVPELLRLEDVKNVQQVLSAVFSSLPNNFGELMKWVVEVRREEDGASYLSKEEEGRLAIKEEVLKQVQETKLFKYVTEWLSSASSCDTNIPFMGDRNISLDNARSCCSKRLDALIKNPGSPDTFSCKSTSYTRLKANGDMTSMRAFGTAEIVSSEQGINMLVPLSETRNYCSSGLANYTERQLGSSDGLTALLLALSPHTWLGIKDEKLLEEICNLVSTESLPPLLQEKVLHLRRQLHLLKECIDNEAGISSPT